MLSRARRGHRVQVGVDANSSMVLSVAMLFSLKVSKRVDLQVVVGGEEFSGFGVVCLDAKRSFPSPVMMH